jgi:hypothetical protein
MIVAAFSNLEARDEEMQTAAIREAADEVSINTKYWNRAERRAA